MLEITLPYGLEDRLVALAAKKGRTKDYYVRKAIVELVEDMEDADIAMERLETPGKRWTMEEIEAELGLGN